MVGKEHSAAASLAVWPDVLAFGLGLGVAAWTGWDTANLVWSLWLSSLVVGYAVIVAHIVRALAQSTRALAQDGRRSPRSAAAGVVVLALFMLAFFTVHFGGFHLGHSVFLHAFFPPNGEPMHGGFPTAETYWTVVKNGWWFIPLALVAERAALRPMRRAGASAPTADFQQNLGAGMMAPYRNVVRLHLLIFFFAFAYFFGLKGAVIYVVVYAVYFFPWRIFRRKRS